MESLSMVAGPVVLIIQLNKVCTLSQSKSLPNDFDFDFVIYIRIIRNFWLDCFFVYVYFIYIQLAFSQLYLSLAFCSIFCILFLPLYVITCVSHFIVGSIEKTVPHSTCLPRKKQQKFSFYPTSLFGLTCVKKCNKKNIQVRWRNCCIIMITFWLALDMDIFTFTNS